jgi:hypothetical protein
MGPNIGRCTIVQYNGFGDEISCQVTGLRYLALAMQEEPL